MTKKKQRKSDDRDSFDTKTSGSDDSDDGAMNATKLSSPLASQPKKRTKKVRAFIMPFSYSSRNWP